MNLSDFVPAGLIQLGTKKFASSGTYTVLRAGYILVTAMGGGASACFSNSSRPGNSAPWGVKLVKVVPGDVLTFTIAAGQPGSGTVAVAGNSTIVQLNGSTIMTAQGGEGNSSTSSFVEPAATVTGADFVMPGRKPQGSLAAMNSSGMGGGAAVDLGWGTASLGGNVGDWATQTDSGVDSSVVNVLGAPNNLYIPAWDVTTASRNVESNRVGVGIPGVNGTRIGYLFSGGTPSNESGGTSIQPAGRGGSGSCNVYSANITLGYGGAGLASIRVFMKI